MYENLDVYANLEMLLVALIVGGSLWFVARGAWRGIRAAGNAQAGCAGCNACGTCPTERRD